PVPITLSYRTVDGTATSASPAPDYRPILGTLTIPAGQTVVTIPLSPEMLEVFGDSLREGNETFKIVVENVRGAVVAKGEATVTIVDDDNSFGATRFLVKIAPQHRVGTYSYAIGP